jgi:hypothetical protein
MKDFLGIALVLSTTLAGFAAAWLIARTFRIRKPWLALVFNIPFFAVASILTFIAATFVEAQYWGASGMYDVELLLFLAVGIIIAFFTSFCRLGARCEK